MLCDSPTRRSRGSHLDPLVPRGDRAVFRIDNRLESPPFGAGGERIEICRGTVRFDERRAGDTTPYQGPPGPVVEFGHRVLWAEVLLSGFHLWQTRGGDSEVADLAVDAHVESIGFGEPDDPASRRKVLLKLQYWFKDEDPTGGEDFNDCFIGFTVIALTK
jgi:hypothetical protein